MIYATSEAAVTNQSMVVQKIDGAGIHAMGALVQDPDRRLRCHPIKSEDIDIRWRASEVVIDEITPPLTLQEKFVNWFAFYEDIEKDQSPKKHGTVVWF